MAKRSADGAYIDVDTTMLKPSPQRIRNILTLEERVAAIKAYDCRPMYTKVAKMFNCSWEQIKNIIANRTAILEFYEATKNAERQNDPHSDDVRQRKIEFLGECVYEYIQRLQFHFKADIHEDLIRSKANEFRDVIRIDRFVPNKAWINHFKATYNFSLSNRQITLTRSPPSSLELRDIMTFCTKQKLQRNSSSNKLTPQPAAQSSQSSGNILYRTSTKMALLHENDATAEELRQRRQRKLNFLERALIEYVTRAKFHLKVTLDDELLCSTAATLRDMLKIDNFQPSRNWLKTFKTRQDFDSIVLGNFAASTRTPPLSLDLKDILSYCSRLEKNSQIGAADSAKCQNGLKQTPVISVVPKSTLMPMNNDNVHRLSGTLKDLHRPLREFKEEIIDLDDDEQNEYIKPEELSHIDENKFSTNPTMTVAATAAAAAASSSSSSSSSSPSPALKIRKIQSMCVNKESEIVLPHSPGHWSETSEKNNDDELPKTVRNYTDALKLLKPLEEFAMLEENYRAIGLLEQLESLFKNPPSKNDDED